MTSKGLCISSLSLFDTRTTLTLRPSPVEIYKTRQLSICIYVSGTVHMQEFFCCQFLVGFVCAMSCRSGRCKWRCAAAQDTNGSAEGCWLKRRHWLRITASLCSAHTQTKVDDWKNQPECIFLTKIAGLTLRIHASVSRVYVSQYTDSRGSALHLVKIGIQLGRVGVRAN